MAMSMQFGDLFFQFTDQFYPAWTDKGSMSHEDGSFWTPYPPDARFRPLGSIGFFGPGHKGYDLPNGKQWALCVADATDAKSGRMPAVADPVGFQPIWSDKKTHAISDGSCWRPIPPANYVACGDVFVKGYECPNVAAVWCVRKDLVHAGQVGERIWHFPHLNDIKDGVKPFSAWPINTIPFVDDGFGLFATNSFIGVPSSSLPSSSVEVYVLKVPIPAEAFDKRPIPPVLVSYDAPADLTTDPITDHIVTVPFTAIKDDMTLAEQVSSSAFYTIRRSVYYTRVLFARNQTSGPQSKNFSVEVGITKTKSDAFSQETAITVGHEAGVEIGKGDFKFGAKASASVTKTLGFSTSTSVEQMMSATLSNTLTVERQCAAASWVLTYRVQLFRANGQSAGKPLSFAIEGTFVDSEYPPPAARHEPIAVATAAGGAGEAPPPSPEVS